MAAGPIRGSFRPPGTSTPNLYSSENGNGVALRRNWKGVSNTSRDSPYTRPASAVSVNGLVEKLTRAVKKVFSYIYQADVSQDSSPSPGIIPDQPKIEEPIVHISNDQAPDQVIPEVKVKAEPIIEAEATDDPTEILSDLILNPLYKQSKQSAFRQIGLFFKAKGEHKLSQYEYDQMSAILRRLAACSIVVQQHFRYPLSSGTASVASTAAIQELDFEPEPEPLPTAVKPSRVFSARYELEGGEEEESPIKAFNREKIFIPVPTESKLNVKEAPRQIRLPLRSSADLKLPEAPQFISSDSAKTNFGKAGSMPAFQTITEPPSSLKYPDSVQPTFKELPKFFVPEIKPVKESEVPVSVAKNLKFDFGLPIIPSEAELVERGKEKVVLPLKTDLANLVETSTKTEEAPFQGFKFAQTEFQERIDKQAQASSFLSFPAQSAEAKGSFMENVPKKHFTFPSRPFESRPLEVKDDLKPSKFEIPHETRPSEIPFAHALKKEPQLKSTDQQAPITSIAEPKLPGPVFAAAEKPKEQPVFNFAPTGQSEQSAQKKPFSLSSSSENKPFIFGQPIVPPSDQPKPSFTLGQPSATEQRPFTFGQPQFEARSAPKRSFSPGIPHTQPEGPKPPTLEQPEGFKPFSSSSQPEKSAGTSAFTFGQPAGEQKTFMFGQQQPAGFTFGQPQPTQTGFSFGQQSQPVGSFVEATKQHQPFGSFSQPAESPSSAPQFNFGSQPQSLPQSQPFIFGQADAGQAMTFSMGSSPATSTSGRKISTPVSRRKHLK